MIVSVAQTEDGAAVLSPHEFMEIYIKSRMAAREGILQQLAAIEDELIGLGALRKRTKERVKRYG